MGRTSEEAVEQGLTRSSPIRHFYDFGKVQGYRNEAFCTPISISPKQTAAWLDGWKEGQEARKAWPPQGEAKKEQS